MKNTRKVGRPPKNLKRKHGHAEPRAENIEIQQTTDVEINHDEKLQMRPFVQIRDEDIVDIRTKVPVSAPINNLQPKLPIEDEAASVSRVVQQELPIDDKAASVKSSVRQESRRRPLKEETRNVKHNVEHELLMEEEAVSSGSKREDSIKSESDEIDEEHDIGDISLAVVDFPNNVQKWGKIPEEEVNKMEKIVMHSKQSGKVGEVLDQLQDLSLYESDNRLYCNAQYALKDSYLKPSPFFAYTDGLKDTQDAATQPNSITMENLIAEEIESMQRIEFYRDTKNDYLNLLNMSKVCPVPKSPPLPSVEVIKEHSRLLEQQIKEMVELLHAQGKISEKLGETIISISEEKKMTKKTENFLRENEESANFITETGIDVLLDNYKK